MYQHSASLLTAHEVVPADEDLFELSELEFDAIEGLEDLDVFSHELAAISEVPGAFLAYVTKQRAVCA